MTPSSKARQQDTRAASPMPDVTKSPSMPRKVVPIPLDKLSKRDGVRTDTRTSGGGQPTQLVAGSDQVSSHSLTPAFG